MNIQAHDWNAGLATASGRLFKCRNCGMIAKIRLARQKLIDERRPGPDYRDSRGRDCGEKIVFEIMES